MSKRSPQPAGEKPAPKPPVRKPFPSLSGISAQRVTDVITLQIAPAVTAGAIAYPRYESEWQAVLLVVSILAVSTLLRRPRYPLHLMPFASAALYLLAPPLGCALAVLISAAEDSVVSDIALGELVAPVLGAWVMTGIGALLNRAFRRGREIRVAVIGSPEFTRGLQAELMSVGVRGYRVIGYIDLERERANGSVAGVSCIGSLSQLRSTIIGHSIELLVLGPLTPGTSGTTEGEFRAAGVSRLDVFEQVAYVCLDWPVSMIDAGQFYEEVFGHVPLGTTTSAWFQYLLHPRYKGGWPLSKRLLDLLLGALAGMILGPVLVLSALAVKLSDGGPIFYRQARIGERGREIELIKFRTMRTDFDEHAATIPGQAEQDWVTPVGHLLRRLHINELPQIWQVLKGEMSLVGPRPEIPANVSLLETRFTYYDRRHLLKPGITGWAQVRCGYSGTPVGEAWKLCHDLYYLKQRSLLFDLLIMLETLRTVFVPEPINRPDERFIVGARVENELLSAPPSEELPAPLQAP